MSAHRVMADMEKAIASGWDSDLDATTQTITGNQAIVGNQTITGTADTVGVSRALRHSFTAAGVVTVAATGSNQGDAAGLNSGGLYIVTGADGTKGVILNGFAAASNGATVEVYNAASSALKIYPSSGGTINGGSANVHVQVPARAHVLFRAIDATDLSSSFITPATTITQTFSTADATHATRTAVALTDNSAGTANTTLQALPDPTDTPATADALRDDLVAVHWPAIRNNFADLAAEHNKLIVDLADTAALLNSVVDALQARGSVL